MILQPQIFTQDRREGEVARSSVTVCVCVCGCGAVVLPYTPYWILSTDYVNSAVVYSCTDVFRIFHVDFAWILGRDRTLPGSTIQRAKAIFMENRIDVSRMIASSQEDCGRTVRNRAVFQSSL